jgi:thioesterase domain-containing protein
VKAPAVLTTLRHRQIQVWADGEQLRCNAPAGALTPELREQLRQHKPEILQFLHSAGSLARQQRAIVPLQPRGDRPPVFAVAGHNGDVFCFRALTQHMGEEQPFDGLQPPGLDGHREPLTTIEDLAAYFAAEIRAFHPKGPFLIAGYCAGGTPAFELARQLLRDGAPITVLVLFGAPFPTSYRWPTQLRRRLAAQIERVAKHTRALAALSLPERRLYIAERLNHRKAGHSAGEAVEPDPVLLQREKVGRATLAAIRRYVPDHFAGRVDLLLPSKAWALSDSEALRWRSVAAHTQEYFGPNGCHTDIMLREPYASTFAELFSHCRFKERAMGR